MDGLCPVRWPLSASTVRLPTEAMAKQSVGERDNLCAPDRLSTWTRKEADPTLAPFLALALADPDEPDAGVTE